MSPDILPTWISFLELPCSMGLNAVSASCFFFCFCDRQCHLFDLRLDGAACGKHGLPCQANDGRTPFFGRLTTYVCVCYWVPFQLGLRESKGSPPCFGVPVFCHGPKCKALGQCQVSKARICMGACQQYGHRKWRARQSMPTR